MEGPADRATTECSRFKEKKSYSPEYPGGHVVKIGLNYMKGRDNDGRSN